MGTHAMLINRKQEVMLHDAANAFIGLCMSCEEWARWNAARLLIRWNALVIKGEAEKSPSVLLKQKIDECGKK